MAMNVVGLFDSRDDAQNAIQQLRSAGFSGDDISFVSRHDDATSTTTTDATFDTSARDGSPSEAEEGAGFGATGGAILGGLAGLLVGLGVIVIPGVGPALAAGSLLATLGSTALGAGIGAAAGGLVGALVGAGIPEEDANVYAEGVRRGSAMVSVIAANDDKVDQVVDIMRDNNVVDIDSRATEFRSGGWSRFDENAAPYARTANVSTTTSTVDTTPATSVDTTATTGTTRTGAVDTTSRTIDTTGKEIRVPVAEEQLQVGKRAVERGGVRVFTRVEQVPVQEQVTLRDEEVHVSRRPVDRPVTDADFTNVPTGTIEVREHDEQAVVDKQARVVEEVRVRKDVEERTETIQDTVRRQDVEVEQIPGRTTTTGTTTSADYTAGTTGSTNEGTIERGVEGLQSGAEKLTGKDLNNSGSTGDRDTRNNY